MAGDVPSIPRVTNEDGRDDYQGPRTYIDPVAARGGQVLEVNPVSPPPIDSDGGSSFKAEPVNEPRLADRVSSMVLRDTQRELDAVRDVAGGMISVMEEMGAELGIEPDLFNEFRRKLGLEPVNHDSDDQKKQSSYRRRRRLGEDAPDRDNYHALGGDRSRRDMGDADTSKGDDHGDTAQNRKQGDAGSGDLLKDNNYFDAQESIKEILDWIERSKDDDEQSEFKVLGAPRLYGVIVARYWRPDGTMVGVGEFPKSGDKLYPTWDVVRSL